MQNGLAAEAAQTCMAMDDFDLLSNHDIAEYGEEGKDGGEGRFAVDDEEGNVVDLESIGEVPDSGAALVRMCDNDDFVPTVDEFLRSH